MLDFDSCVAMRLPKWRVSRVGKRVSQYFSAQFTLGVSTVNDIKKESFRFRRLWAACLRDLAAKRLWFFYPGETVDVASATFNMSRFELTYRRCMCCRPSFLFFYPSRRMAEAGKINYQIRPCNRPTCPFCFARRSQWQFLYVKRQLNKLLKTADTPISLVYRTRREFVAAPEFATELSCGREVVLKAAERLRAVVNRHRAAHSRLVRHKQLHRKTLGSLWRVVVIPAADGWFVETRQFLAVARGQKKLPLAVLAEKTTGVCNRLAFSRTAGDYHELNDRFYAFFGEFCRYPKELLTTYTELLACVLYATAGASLTEATGIFRGASMRGTACFNRLQQHNFAVKNARRE